MMVDIQNLEKTYRNGRQKTEVLKGVTLQVEERRFCALMGPSGCGKSTLLHVLCGIEKPDSGRCTVAGANLSVMKEKELSKYRSEKIGVVFQGFYLDESRSLLDNVAMPLGYAGIGKRERRKKAAALLKRVGLEGKEKKRPSQVSGGEQQRAAIARALVNEPKLLLADEPTGNLDEENTRHIMELFSKLHDEGMTILMVTHDREVADYADEIVTMRDGKCENIAIDF